MQRPNETMSVISAPDTASDELMNSPNETTTKPANPVDMSAVSGSAATTKTANTSNTDVPAGRTAAVGATDVDTAVGAKAVGTKAVGTEAMGATAVEMGDAAAVETGNAVAMETGGAAAMGTTADAPDATAETGSSLLINFTIGALMCRYLTLGSMGRPLGLAPKKKQLGSASFSTFLQGTQVSKPQSANLGLGFIDINPSSK